MTRQTPTDARRLVLGRETLRTLGGAKTPGRAETCMGACSCLCGPDTLDTADAK
jgi:hypothetical protein